MQSKDCGVGRWTLEGMEGDEDHQVIMNDRSVGNKEREGETTKMKQSRNVEVEEE